MEKSNRRDAVRREKNNPRIRPATRDWLIVMGIAACMYALLDLAVGHFLPYQPKPSAVDEDRLNHCAYSGEPYFSEDFLVESYLQPGGWQTPANTRLVLPNEYHGKFLNVDVVNGIQVTYPLMENAIAKLQREDGIEAYNLTHLFRDAEGPIFLDFCHVNSRGNLMIATELATIILGQKQ